MDRHAQTAFTGLLLITSFLLPGCVTPVIVDFDREAALKFEGYTCFVIDTPEEIPENPEDVFSGPIVNRRFARELDASLKARGYTGDCSTPDFRVRFNTSKKTVTDIDFNWPNNSNCFYYHGFHPNVGYFPPPYINRYEEGTFLIDIIDEQSGELVWRGTYVKRLGRQALKDREVRSIIDSILDRFPPGERTPQP